MHESQLVTAGLLLTGGAILILIFVFVIVLKTRTAAGNTLNEDVFQQYPQRMPKDVYSTRMLDYFQYMPWFGSLQINDKIRFVNRIQLFVESKIFEGRKGLIVTPEMRLVISAEACKLTFGLQEFLLSDFDRIVIYPDSFFSRTGKARHNGEVNINGIIVFSWKHFLSGISNAHDSINLGLHEFTHALRFQGVRGGKQDAFFSMYYPKFRAVSLRLMQKLKQNKVLRQYGFTNEEEFLAVCAEHFFEAPQNLYKNSPELYEHLCILLNQHPLQAEVSAISQRQQYLNINSHNIKNTLLLLQSTPINPFPYYLKHFFRLLAPALFLGGIFWIPELIALSIISFYIVVIQHLSSSGNNSEVSFYEDRAVIRFMNNLRFHKIQIPYQSITKTEYIEEIRIINDEPDLFSARNKNTPTADPLTHRNLTLHVMTPSGIKQYKSILGNLTKKESNNLIRYLRRQDIWVRMRLVNWLLDDFPHKSEWHEQIENNKHD